MDKAIAYMSKSPNNNGELTKRRKEDGNERGYNELVVDFGISLELFVAFHRQGVNLKANGFARRAIDGQKTALVNFPSPPFSSLLFRARARATSVFGEEWDFQVHVLPHSRYTCFVGDFSVLPGVFWNTD